MNDKRIPKPDEEWTYEGNQTPVVNVYPDAVTIMWGDRLTAETLEAFVESYTPPEPTAVDTLWLSSAAEPNEDDRTMFTCWAKQGNSTHRLDLLSDGEFRVVKL